MKEKRLKRLIAFMLAIISTISTLITNVFAFTVTNGDTCYAYESGYFKGSDGYYYTYPETSTGHSHYEYVVYDENGDGTYWYADFDIDKTDVTKGARTKWFLQDSNGSMEQCYCIEPGVPFGDKNEYVASSGTNNNYFNNLPLNTKLYVYLATLYGWSPGKVSPVAGTNADDYAYATQVIIWEFVQQVRKNPSSRIDNQWGVPADMFYLSVKGRPAEKCYNWILEKMASHSIIPSFTAEKEGKADVYTMKYNPSLGKYTITLTDTNNTGYPIKTSSSYGITVTKTDNRYTFTSQGRFSSPMTISYKKNVSSREGTFLVWGCPGKQTLATGAYDPTQFFVKLKTEDDGIGKIVKQSEDGNIEGIEFTIEGNGKTYNVVTGSDGTVSQSLIPGTYTVTETTPNVYETQNSQTLTVTSGETSTVTFNNTLKKGDVKVIKTAEDGFVEGVKFNISGTSLNGTTINQTVETDKNGEANFNDVLISDSKGYTLTEVSTGSQYITPDAQNVVVEWNKVTNKSVYNELKKGSLEVIKTAEDGFVEGVKFHLYGTALSGAQIDLTASTDAAGVARFEDVLISDENGYTLEEADTKEQYIVPDSQTVAINWNEVTKTSMDNVLKRGNVEVVKMSEDGLVEGMKFRLYGTALSGANVDLTVTTDANGVARFDNILISDVNGYTLEEVDTGIRYIVPATQNVTILWNETTQKVVFNELKKGSLEITKTSEDGLVEGIKFHLYGTSLSGAEIDLYALTDANGIARFEDVLISGEVPYVLEEVDTAEKYIVPESLNVSIEWQKTKKASFYNELKRGSIEIRKTSEDGFVENVKFRIFGTSLSGEAIEVFAVTDENGIARFDGILISDAAGYTIEEVETGIRYIVPDSQNAIVLWNETSQKEFHNEVKKGSVEVTKTSEDGLVEGVIFHLSGFDISGHVVDLYATTDADGIARFENVPITGKTPYVLEEVDTKDWYIIPETQEVTVTWNEATKVNVENILKRGTVKVTKTAEDGFVEGVKFHLYGTSLSGEKVDLYALTDKDGIAVFEDVLISGEVPYVLEEVLTEERYIVPDEQELEVFWNAVMYSEVENILKKYSVTILKKDSKTDMPLAGAEFALFAGEDIVGPAGEIIAAKDEMIGNFKSGEDGKISFVPEYPYADLYVKEVGAPEGYELSEDIINLGFEYTEDEEVEFVVYNEKTPVPPSAGDTNSVRIIVAVMCAAFGVIIITITVIRKKK